MIVIELGFAGVVAVFLFVGLHYFPWRRVLPGGRKEYILDPPLSYVCGMLGLGLIYSGLVAWWWLSGHTSAYWQALAAFWVVTGAGGGAILVCYALDAHLEKKAREQDEGVRRQIEESH